MSKELLARLEGLVGSELGPGDWQLVDQPAIDRFAGSTGDHQWIHTDPERAARESPFGATVAHGMYTLALAPAMAIELLDLQSAPLVINYGLNRVRFPAPLFVGTRVRMDLTLTNFESVKDGARLTVDTRLSDDRQAKPVCVAQLLLQVHE